jgi:hypothetical protein
MNFEKIIYQAQVIAKDTPDLYKRAKKLGLVEGHPSISLFESVLCETEKPNSNKIRLAEDAIKDSIDTAKFQQINFNHVGKGAICGFIFDSFINKKKQVVISCVFFKKIYASEYNYAKKLFAKNELTMSYELTADLDTQEKLSDGTRRINDFYFTGAGLLLGETPACKNAVVYEFAKQMEDCRQELLFASQRNLNNVSAIRYKKMDSILASLICRLQIDGKEEKIGNEKGSYLNNQIDSSEQLEKGGKIVMNIEEIKAKLSEELGELVKDWTDDDFQNEEKIAKAREMKKETDETAEKTVVESEEKMNTTTTYDNEEKTETVKSEYEIEVRRDGKIIRTSKTDSENIYLYAQVEAIKAEYEKQINELKATLEIKNSEIVEVRANAEKIAKLKIENANNEFTKEFKDEDWLNAEKIEEAKKLQTRLEKIQANKETLKDNEFAKNFTDDDYANDDKVVNVKLQAELKAREIKIKELETSSLQVEENVQAVQKKNDDLDTNHQEDVSSSQKNEGNILVNILKENFKK